MISPIRQADINRDIALGAIRSAVHRLDEIRQEMLNAGGIGLKEPQERVRELQPDEAEALDAAARDDYRPIMDFRPAAIRVLVQMVQGQLARAGR